MKTSSKQEIRPVSYTHLDVYKRQIFDFLKKTEATKTTESNKEAEEAKGNACLGVLDLFPMKETNQLLIVGSLEGSIKVGDQLQFCNPDQGMESLGTIAVSYTHLLPIHQNSSWSMKRLDGKHQNSVT